jgi:hypothetical protein
MKRVIGILALLVAPGLALGQAAPKVDTERKLQELEAKLSALLHEVKAIRGAAAGQAKTGLLVTVQPGIEQPGAKAGTPMAIQPRVAPPAAKVAVPVEVHGRMVQPGALMHIVTHEKTAGGNPGEVKVQEQVIIVGDKKVTVHAEPKQAESQVIVVTDGKPGEHKVNVITVPGHPAAAAANRRVFVTSPDGKRTAQPVAAGTYTFKGDDGIEYTISVATSKAVTADSKSGTQPKVVTSGNVKVEKKVMLLNSDGTWKELSPEEAKKYLDKIPHAPSAAHVPSEPKQFIFSPATAAPGTAAGAFSFVPTMSAAAPASGRTYTLPAAKAQALAGFLKEHAKVKGLQMKIEGDKLTVTAGADVQLAIEGLVSLMTGKPGAMQNIIRYVPQSTPILTPATKPVQVKPVTPPAAQKRDKWEI